MSSESSIIIVIASATELVKAVAECGAEIYEETKFKTDNGTTHAVSYVATHGNAKVGVQIDNKTQKVTFIPYDCNGNEGKSLAGRISQQYAYSRVLMELKKKGYQLTKEQKSADGTIQLVADKWR